MFTHQVSNEVATSQEAEQQAFARWLHEQAGFKEVKRKLHPSKDGLSTTDIDAVLAIRRRIAQAHD